VAFTAAAIPLIFVKGLTLGKLAYADPFAKMSQDIDIFVPGGSIAEAATVLDQIGYDLEIPPGSAQLGRWHRQPNERSGDRGRADASTCTAGSPTAPS
jgi:hypothetical protein